MLKTVNGGIIKNIEGLEVEILSHNFHNPHANVVCYYFINENGGKTEITYHKNIYSGNDGHEIYLFNKTSDLQHYKSYNYLPNKLPKKYQELAKKLKHIHSLINFDEYKTRN